jgi:hypothetical protein
MAEKKKSRKAMQEAWYAPHLEVSCVSLSRKEQERSLCRAQPDVFKSPTRTRTLSL